MNYRIFWSHKFLNKLYDEIMKPPSLSRICLQRRTLPTGVGKTQEGSEASYKVLGIERDRFRWHGVWKTLLREGIVVRFRGLWKSIMISWMIWICCNIRIAPPACLFVLWTMRSLTIDTAIFNELAGGAFLQTITPLATRSTLCIDFCGHGLLSTRAHTVN